jgi:transcription antitermination factor NusG
MDWQEQLKPGLQMPILKREDDIWPSDLLAVESPWLNKPDFSWWCVYTLSRREKDLIRKLASWEIPHYAPMIPKRFRSPAGRMRTSFVPLFPNYVFMLADGVMRHQAMTSNCISRCNEIVDHESLVTDLRQIASVVNAGEPLTPEARLEPGDRVRVRTGPFRNCEGTVIRREGKTRLLLSVRYLEQGVSMQIDEGVLEPA